MENSNPAHQKAADGWPDCEGASPRCTRQLEWLDSLASLTHRPHNHADALGPAFAEHEPGVGREVLGSLHMRHTDIRLCIALLSP